MEVDVLTFGVTSEMLGSKKVTVELVTDATVSNLKYVLEARYPALKALSSYMIAINNEYALPEDYIHQHDEVALIPPVSGG